MEHAPWTQALAVAAGFILWKSTKGQERIKQSRNSGGGGDPRKTSKPKKRLQRAKREVGTHRDLLGISEKTLKV
jgi:hypothetical protein